MESMEQKARDLLENMGIENAQNFSAGDLTELANLLQRDHERSSVNHPAHYNEHPSGVECITIVEGFNFNLGNAIKYIWRAGLKSDNTAEDLRKASWYIQREIERLAK